MIRYNLKAALRSILRFKSHTVISLLGLVLGLACVFVISAWTIQELMFDKFHEDTNRFSRRMVVIGIIGVTANLAAIGAVMYGLYRIALLFTTGQPE